VPFVGAVIVGILQLEFRCREIRPRFDHLVSAFAKATVAASIYVAVMIF
jgi:hypothetical protein